MAIHLALAFLHFEDFGFDHAMFHKFWNLKFAERHKEFISFIGRHVVSRESARIWIEHNKIDLKKVKLFWDWALEYCDAEALSGFGFWINTESGVFEMPWLARRARQTLEKTNGYVEWDYGLTKSLDDFAEESPEDTLMILRAYLLEEVAKHEPTRTLLHMNEKIYAVFRELYKHDTLKKAYVL